MESADEDFSQLLPGVSLDVFAQCDNDVAVSDNVSDAWEQEILAKAARSLQPPQDDAEADSEEDVAEDQASFSTEKVITVLEAEEHLENLKMFALSKGLPEFIGNVIHLHEQLQQLQKKSKQTKIVDFLNRLANV